MPLDGAVALYEKPAEVREDLAVFERAAQEIERRGWHQGGTASAQGRVCMMMAVCAAAGKEFQTTKMYFEAINYYALLGFPLGEKSPLVWNDAPGRTQAEVIDRLRRAARGEWA
jgi:hypothetical protein